MKNPIFDVLHTWVVDAGFFSNAFFKEIESYLEIVYLIKNVKKELREVSMGKKKTVIE